MLPARYRQAQMTDRRFARTSESMLGEQHPASFRPQCAAPRMISASPRSEAWTEGSALSRALANDASSLCLSRCRMDLKTEKPLRGRGREG